MTVDSPVGVVIDDVVDGVGVDGVGVDGVGVGVDVCVLLWCRRDGWCVKEFVNDFIHVLCVKSWQEPSVGR